MLLQPNGPLGTWEALGGPGWNRGAGLPDMMHLVCVLVPDAGVS